MFSLPDLSYDYDALEPHIDAQTMEIHHSKHHQGYVNNLNSALEGHNDFLSMNIHELLTSLDKLPDDKKQAVTNNGGGHANHSLYWEVMSPDGGGEPTGSLADALNSTFGSFDEFKKKFTEKASTVFGSGWAWLVVLEDGSLELARTSFQNNPLMKDHSCTPILGI
ncbi:superoxide dismutase, partial [Candidatus Dojkabacteria bacterium]|nr:superoxide dismutase [Candidatus Dojkabacteria bacterium]